ncbi:MAG: putative quinol monooxygenase [Candidatus Nanopelagicales bacterium]|jgi:quinol monooxygenase YgiN
MEPLYLVAVIKPRAERAEEVVEALRVMMAATRAEAGCELYDLVVGDDEPDTWLMLEKWSTRADWEAHMVTDHVVAGNEAVADLLREPTELRFYSAR